MSRRAFREIIIATPFAAGLIEWHAQHTEQTQ